MSGSSTDRTGMVCPTATPAPPPQQSQADQPTRPGLLEPLSALLTRRHADLRVAARPLADYARLAASHPEETR